MVLSRGLFMNKYVFPGADASCSLGWVTTQLEAVGFEVKNVDVLGVHYSATIYRWYKNWVSNKDKVIAEYGERWYRIWVFFLAYSVLISRCVTCYPSLKFNLKLISQSNGGAAIYQFTLHKNLNGYPRIEGVRNHASIKVTPSREIQYVLLKPASVKY